MHVANIISGLLALKYTKELITMQYKVWSDGIPSKSKSSFECVVIGVPIEAQLSPTCDF